VSGLPTVLLAFATLLAVPTGAAAQTPPHLVGEVVEAEVAHDRPWDRYRVRVDAERAPAVGSAAQVLEDGEGVAEPPGPATLRWSVEEIGDGFVWIRSAPPAVRLRPGDRMRIYASKTVPWPSAQGE